jgi:hypothetical protein
VLRFFFAVVICMSLISCAAQQDKIYFAASTNGSEGNPFLGFYQDGNFVRTEPKWSRDPEVFIRRIVAATAAFKPGVRLKGLSRDGKRSDAVLESFHEPSLSLGDQLLSLRLQIGANPSGDVLFWTANAELKYLQPILVRLEGVVDELLRRRTLLLWQQAVHDYPPELNEHSIEIGSPLVQTVADAKDIITVLYPIIIKGKDKWFDDRASVFFIYSLSENKIILQTFGHPEWSPRAENVITVRPIVYFRIANDRNVYFFGERSGAWEHFGYAIYDFRSGAAVLESY